MSALRLTGYGPSNQWQKLVFDGDERKYELWETRLYKADRIKEVFGVAKISIDKNELVFSELVQYLDERSLSRSLSLVMQEH